VGLHGQTKDGEVVKVNVPKDCMIIQIGEAMEILTGGLIKALPHAVLPLRHKGPGVSPVSRNTMALFIDPTHQDELCIPPERTESQLFQCDKTEGLLTPKLSGRWLRGDTYGTFYLRSLAAYKQPAKQPLEGS
jgi:isopenicillin N synthase-like dioxygenase